MPYPKTPELDKVRAFKNSSQLVGVFLEWLLDGNQHLLEELSIEQILAKYYGIDLKKVSQEKDAIYEWIQSDEFVVDNTLL